ncbi:MAG TPA: ATP-binding protein [Anaerolineaceae bacterium]|nr:ATP-binding protein [Anaerolineaceae bacterium]
MANNANPKHIIPKAFPGITSIEVNELIQSSEVQTFPPGTVLCQENALEYTFYIILEGAVQVSKTINNVERRLLKTLGPGDFFGEMALIHNAPRAATVVTTEPTTVLIIQKPAFDNVLHSSTSVSLALTREISRRLRENDELAIEDLRLRADELARAYQQLSELEFARREFLTTIAHELRTPLMVANGFLQTVQSGKMEGEILKSALDTVSRNVQQIVALVNDILFLQEMDLILPKFQAVNLGEIVLSVVQSLAVEAGQNNVNFKLEVSTSLPPLQGDPKSLERAIRAIVENAIKFSPEGGDVIIHTGADDAWVWIEIQDHGVGITPEVLPRIFDRFFHVEKIDGYLFRGVGLGLSIAKQVIEQHSGRIEVFSQPGQGSLIKVWLSRPHEK